MMNKKALKILVGLIFLIIFQSSIQAQSEEQKVKLTLINGHELTGQLVEYIPDDKVTIMIGDGQEITFTMEQLKSVKMTDVVTKKPYEFRETGWYNRTSISALTGESATGYSLNHTVSYQLDRRLSIGVGGGVDNYYKQDGYNIIPVFVELKSFLLARNESPFVALRGGYAFASNDEEIGQIRADGGWMINPTVGYRLSGGDFMVDLFIGVKVQKSDYEYLSGETRVTDDIRYNRLDIGIGFMF
jgi:opacity protein-like surface antigen